MAESNVLMSAFGCSEQKHSAGHHLLYLRAPVISYTQQNFDVFLVVDVQHII